jgi:hypothetical protein
LSDSKKECSIRAINRALGVRRTIIREVRDRARAEGWLDPKAPLPKEDQVQENIRGDVDHQTANTHPLDEFKELSRQKRIDDEYIILWDLPTPSGRRDKKHV